MSRASPALQPLPADASREARVEALRAHLQQIAPARIQRPSRPTGLPSLDAAVGGWPAPGLAEVHGRPGTGRLSLVLPTLRDLMVGDGARPGQAVAVVDPVGWLHPPGLPDLPLERLLVVRPGARGLWAAEQLARSGAVPLVLLLDPPPLGRSARRLLHAAEAGSCTVIVVDEQHDTSLPASLRIETLGHGTVHVHRGARPGHERLQPGGTR